MPKANELERECCLTRTVKPSAELIRFVLSPEGVLFPDVDAKAEGRGVWVTATEAAVGEAARKKAFARSLKEPVKLPDDLPALTCAHLTTRVLGALGLARKAGQAVIGATRVRAAIDSGSMLALLTANDAAADGRQKILAPFLAVYPPGSVPHFEILSSDQLGLALGGGNVIHAALVSGAAAQSALTRALRLAHYVAPKTAEMELHG